MTDAGQHELQALAAALAQRTKLAARLRALESEREALERTIEQADAAVDEAVLDRALARLRSIERERTQSQLALDAYHDLDLRYATAIHDKYERLVHSAPDHVVLRSIEPLFAEGHEIRAQLADLDEKLHRVADVEHHLRQLRETLAEADTMNTLDALTPAAFPLEAAASAVKQRSIRAAREHGARAKDALVRLLGPGRAAAAAAGPTPPLGLNDFDIGLLDGVSDDLDFSLAYSLSKWDYDSRKLQQRVAQSKRVMLEQRQRLELRLAEITAAYQQLIASA